MADDICQTPRQVFQHDYRVLMVKRSAQSSFMANAFVYPGGLCEKSDFSPDWWEVFERAGATKDVVLRDLCNATRGDRPPMIAKPLTLASENLDCDDHLPSDLACRVCAIRETFEETGVLLLREKSPFGSVAKAQVLSEKYQINVAEWRRRLREDVASFLALCLNSKLCPDVWALHEWWDWLTPVSAGPKRYDTMFYVCCLDSEPDVVLDDGEVTVSKWWTPVSALRESRSGAVFLAPPQVYESARLLNRPGLDALSEFAAARSKEGVRQWMPVVASAQDGLLILLPGDDLYPEEPDYFGRDPGQRKLSSTLRELRGQVQNFHRMEVKNRACTVYSNITPPCGQLKPLTFTDSDAGQNL